MDILTPQRLFILNSIYSKKINFTLLLMVMGDQSDQANFVTIRTGVNNLSLTDSININNPEIYFLQIDNNSGFYFANTFALIPFFISSKTKVLALPF